MTSKIIKRVLLAILLLIVSYGIYYAWRAFPIVSGYGAKALCSCVFVGERQPSDVVANELGDFPLSLGNFKLQLEDSSAIGTVWGMARQKAIYRKGLGCTLLADASEETVRNQRYQLPQPALQPDSLPWPLGTSASDSITSGVDLARLTGILDSAMADQKQRRMRAALVVYDGQLIAEKYAPGFSSESKLIGWSMAKSITNALLGILAREEKISVNNHPEIDDWKNDDRATITINHLMQASSGLDWEENYGGPSGATNMLYKENDMGRYAANVSLKHAPGSYFYYSSGTSNILSRIVRTTVGDNDYYSFPYRELFHKIGMTSAVLEPDASGTFVGSSYPFATARDWARFGLLYYNDGMWNGERILPEGWVEYSTTPAPAAPMGEYGAQWWLNAGSKDNPANRRYPDVPTDCFWADGYEGQNVWVIPSKKLIVIRLSCEHGNILNENKFLADIISCLPE